MAKKKEEKKETVPAGKKYVGAKWISGPAQSPEFGELETGKIYPLPEARAKNAPGFDPVYTE